MRTRGAILLAAIVHPGTIATGDAFGAATGLLREGGWRALEIESPLSGGFVK